MLFLPPLAWCQVAKLFYLLPAQTTLPSSLRKPKYPALSSKHGYELAVS
jgi:hypothetical protein